MRRGGEVGLRVLCVLVCASTRVSFHVQTHWVFHGRAHEVDALLAAGIGFRGLAAH